MAGLASFTFKLSQFYPGASDHLLNTCSNPDCSNFGQSLTDGASRRKEWAEKRPDLTSDQLDKIEKHEPGAQKLAGADQKHGRVSRVFEYQEDHHCPPSAPLGHLS